MQFFLLYWKYLAAAAVLAALAVFYNAHVDGLIHVAVTKAVTERDNDWRASEARGIAKARADAAAQEAAHQAKLDEIDKTHKQEIANGKAQSARDVAAVRAGFRLSIPASCPSGTDVPRAAGGADPAPQTTALPAGLTERLLGLANAADDALDELNTCWQVVAADRQVSPPVKGSAP